jgi:hypothetical protein
MGDARERAIERLASMLLSRRFGGRPVEAVDADVSAYKGDTDWESAVFYAEDIIKVLGLVAVDPALVEAVESAERSRAGAGEAVRSAVQQIVDVAINAFTPGRRPTRVHVGREVWLRLKEELGAEPRSIWYQTKPIELRSFGITDLAVDPIDEMVARLDIVPSDGLRPDEFALGPYYLGEGYVWRLDPLEPPCGHSDCAAHPELAEACRRGREAQGGP